MKNENLSRLEGKEPASSSRSVCCPQGRDISRAIENNIIPRTPTLRGDVSEAVTTAPVCGMTTAASGFTLIELLVVVLIIGILAAVALPQYNKAVLKAQSRNLFVIMENIRRAEEAYYLDNNTYTRKWNELDISFPSAGGWNLSLWDNDVQSKPSKYSGVTVYFFFEHTSHIWKGKRVCYAAMNKPKANQFCQAMAGHTTPDTSNGPNTVNIYIIP